MENLKVIGVTVVTDLCILVTFSNNEKRIFDATYLMKYPVYKDLSDFNIFKKIEIQHGIITWENGKIDVDTQTVYDNSFEYEVDDVVSAG